MLVGIIHLRVSIFTCSWLLETTTSGVWLAGELSPVLLWTKHYTLTNLNQPLHLNTVKFFFFKCIILTLTLLRNVKEPKVLMPFFFFFNQWKILKASIYYEAKLQIRPFFFLPLSGGACEAWEVLHNQNVCSATEERRRKEPWRCLYIT